MNKGPKELMIYTERLKALENKVEALERFKKKTIQLMLGIEAVLGQYCKEV